jgi:HEPN domain-containing protein
MAAVSRSDLQSLASSKLSDAKLLLRRGRYSSAYYLAGYAVEFALKSAIARQIQQHVLPDPRFIREVYQHDLDRLVGLARLRVDLDGTRRASARFDANWVIVSDWSVESRYELLDSVRGAAMVKAVSERSSGVFQWVQQHW